MVPETVSSRNCPGSEEPKFGVSPLYKNCLDSLQTTKYGPYI